MIFFIYFLNLFCFVDFFEYFKFKLQVYGVMQYSVLKNIIHIIWCILSLYPRLAALGKEGLCRVPEIWPSAKPQALGKERVSSSVCNVTKFIKIIFMIH